MRAVLFLVITCCACAQAAEEEPIKAPYAEKGECWSYRAEGMAYQPLSHEYEYCITLIDRSKRLVLGLVTLKDGGREFDTVHSEDLATYASHSGLISSEGVRFYRFPLKTGDRYSIEFEFRDARYGPNAGKASYDIRIVGWEDVSVPAGVFRAMKVEGSGTVQRYDRHLQFPHQLTMWYSPKVNRHVKYRYQNPGRVTAEELTGYRLNQ